MCIDQRRADPCSRMKAEFVRRLFRQPCADRRAGRDNLGSDPRIVLGSELLQTNTLKVRRAPALLMGLRMVARLHSPGEWAELEVRVYLM